MNRNMVALVLHILVYLFLTFVFDNSANDYISLMMFQQKKNDKSTFQTDIHIMMELSNRLKC